MRSRRHARFPYLFLPCLAALAASPGGCARQGGTGTKPAAGDPPAVPAPRFDGLEGFWSAERAEALLDEAERFTLEADLSTLTAGERRALERLMEVGEIVEDVYEASRHPEALAVRAHLASLSAGSPEERARLDALRDLYALFQGPIAVEPPSARVAFAPVDAYTPGRAVYPADATAEALAAWTEAHPDARLADVRTVVRRRTADALVDDLAALDAHPALEALHPGLRESLEVAPDPDGFYAVPYAVAWADELDRARRLLFAAADDVRADDADLADYLEQRARDLLSNDYEAGDAAWVTGRFQRLNAEVGAYETYDDHLLGQKAFFAVSLLVRAPEASAQLARAIAGLADHEAALPGGPYGPVRGEIPVGIYDVVADYGQARGGNTASILPNEAHVVRKYGRTILIRRNVLTHPTLVAAAERRFRAIVAEAHGDDLGAEGNFHRTVWHEVGHYLGPKETADGRTVTAALGPLHNHFEELKADLVSLWLVPRLVDAGVMDEDRARAVRAAGVLRASVGHEPARSEPYATMRLMQQNWYLDRGVLRFRDGTLAIDYDRFPNAVEEMLGEVLRIQHAGDAAVAEAFVDRWARFRPELQGVLAAKLSAAAGRYRFPSYAALADR